jgi:hypothetical protein
MSVRWDAVVKNNTFWSSKRVADATAAAAGATGAAAPVEVQVWLFGGLAGPGVKNPLTLRLATDSALRSVFDELGCRLGTEFLRTVFAESGESRSTCRVFLDGEPTKDMATPISAGAAPATVEIILFREIEGG